MEMLRTDTLLSASMGQGFIDNDAANSLCVSTGLKANKADLKI